MKLEEIMPLKGDKGEKGEPGEKGDSGLSAYEVAVKNGFEGTEQEWLASLNGGTQSDWEQTDDTSIDYIKNKPSIPSAITDLEGILPIEKGGTGATTVEQAWQNLKIFTDISQLALTYKTTTGKIYQAMPVGSIGLFSFENNFETITDAPCSKGIFTIFYPVKDRPLLLCQQCISNGMDYASFYVGYFQSVKKQIVWYRIRNGALKTSIEHGGTGADTAEQALVNLGAAKSADIGDVTTLATTDKTVVGAINELYSLINTGG